MARTASLHRLVVVLAAGATLTGSGLVACNNGAPGGTTAGTHPVGATSFTSQAPGGAARGKSTTGATGAAGAPGTATGAPTPDANTGTTAARTVEEADIYQRDGSTLYVLNTYRGLQVLDLSDVTKPLLIGHVALSGDPVDLYLRTVNGRRTALVAVRDAFTYVRAADGSLQPHRGSRVLAVDVTTPSAPSVVSDLPVTGALEQTRLVGNVLYVASNKYYWYDWVGVGSTANASPAPGSGSGAIGSIGYAGGDTFYVASFDLADPAHPAAVDQVEFPATGWSAHANVTAERITISFAGYQPSSTGAWAPVTNFQVVDISDPGGKLAIGATFSTNGQVKDRWGMDYDAATKVFRAAVNLAVNQGAAVVLWSSPSAGVVTPLAQVPIAVPESLTAARFDGPRIYVVTARLTDPLWVIDATDPAHPKNVGALHMPGQLDFIEPRGDRLLALGHTNEAGQAWQLQVSLVDVSDVNAMGYRRVLLGNGYGSVAATPDDLRKAFLVFEPTATGPGLVLVPFYGYDKTSWRATSGTQLIDWTRDPLTSVSSPLTARGFLAHPGMVTRAFPIDAGLTRLAALSDTSFQTIDAADRGNPAELGRIDLARSVTTLAPVKDKLVELAGDWWSGDMELAIVAAADPDAATPLARVDLAAPQARLLQDGDVLWVLATDWSSSPSKSWLQGVDVSDPVHPVQRGRVELATGESWTNVRYWGWGNEAVLVGHTLVVHHAGALCWEVCATTAAGSTSVTGSVSGTSQDPAQLRIYDLSNPDAPRLASTVTPPGASWAYGLTASGRFLWLTHFEWNATMQDGRYYLDRIDLSDPANPQLLPKINVPGVFFAASPDGSRIFTLEATWDASWNVRVQLHRLRILASDAVLEASVALDGYPNGQAIDGGYAWIAVQPNTSYAVQGSTSSGTSGSSTVATAPAQSTRLVTIDLAAMAVTDDQAVSGSWAWLRSAAGGKLFLFAGWGEQGLVLYDLATPAKPTFDRFVRTSSWVWDVIVANGRAYLPSGPYGVPVIELH